VTAIFRFSLEDVLKVGSKGKKAHKA